MDATSASLLDQLRGPERGPAWSKFVRLYTPLLAYWAGRAGVPPADRSDLIQDVFLVLVRIVPTFQYDPGRSFRSWLHTVLVNKWKDACRKKSALVLTADGSNFPSPAIDDPILLIDESEYRAVLAARAARLIEADFNAATWQAFWKTAVEEQPVADVAVELGLSANAVYLARSRVLARLRQELVGLWE